MIRLAITGALLLAAWLLVFGSPFAGAPVLSKHHYGSPVPILPMSFAHHDHVTVGCIDCHHNYVDDTGHEQCMHCHVSDPELLQALELQFHTLCRDCHATLAAQGEPTGPPRQCVSCHTEESVP